MRMDEDILRKYRKAGRIAKKAREFGIELVDDGVSMLEVADRVEQKILEMGGRPAFPVNISVNHVAAHFSPKHDDRLVLKKGDVVKIDVGVHVDGFIADTADTKEIGMDKYHDLIESSRSALWRAIEEIRPGRRIGEIGKIVSETIKSKGFRPVRNLSGHSMDRYILHAGLSIPNVSTREKMGLREGMVLAIEPFATLGSGYVRSKGGSNIYRYLSPPSSRELRLRILSERIKRRFKTLPFAERWFVREFPNLFDGLERLVFLKSVYHYPRLVDTDIVSQHEHTIIVTSDGCEVIT